MKRIYFLQPRTFEGYTYAVDNEYEVDERLYMKLLQTYPVVIRDVETASSKVDAPPLEIIAEVATESVTPITLEELVIESKSSEIIEIESAVDDSAGETLEIDEAVEPEETDVHDIPLNLPGVPEKAVALLMAADFTSNKKVAEASDEELTAIEGIGPSYLNKIRAALE